MDGNFILKSRFNEINEENKALKKLVSDRDRQLRDLTGRLVMTEEAYFSSAVQGDYFNELDVEQYEIVETLDSHTSGICRSLDGKVFPMKDFEPGVTAPPFHVYCRSTTVPYFEDDFGQPGERAARGEDGKTYYVPADMTYEEWKKTFVDGGEKSGMKETEFSPRKATKGEFGVDWTKIQSLEYRKSLEWLSGDSKVVDAIETRAKWTLNNRNGLKTEELYAVDLGTGDEIASILGQQIKFGVRRTPLFTRRLNEADEAKKNILLIHNHPRGMPPSLGDLNSLVKNKHASGITVGHDGSIYYYTRPEKKYRLLILKLQYIRIRGILKLQIWRRHLKSCRNLTDLNLKNYRRCSNESKYET